jgi:hypothetical protein
MDIDVLNTFHGLSVGNIFTITGPISIDFSCLLGVYFRITLVSLQFPWALS